MTSPNAGRQWDTQRTADMLSMTRQNLEKLARQKVIPSPLSGVWDFEAVTPKYIEWIRDRATSVTKDDKARKMKADADTAEMERSKMAGELVLRSDYLSDYADAIAVGISRISRLKNLSTEQKESVFSELRAVKLPDLKPAVIEDEDESKEE